jgi:hypothetical protein
VASRSDRPPRCRYRPPPRLKPRRRARVGASSRAQRDGRLIRCAVARAGTSSRAPVIRVRLRSTTATSARSSSGASLVSWGMSATTPLPNALSRTCEHREPAGPRLSSITAAASRDVFCVVSQDDAGAAEAVASGRLGGRRGWRSDDASVDSKQGDACIRQAASACAALAGTLRLDEEQERIVRLLLLTKCSSGTGSDRAAGRLLLVPNKHLVGTGRDARVSWESRGGVP